MPTTINDELLRIEGAKADIATAIGNKGVTVPANAKIDDFADLIDAIQTGGGGTDDTLLKIMNKTITSVDIPSGVTSVPNYFFSNCASLSSVIFPSTLTSIGENSFMRCSNLTSISIPNAVTTIENRSFSYSGLTTLTIPNSVTSIGEYCFERCSNLTDVVIGNGVISLGRNAFSMCTELLHLTIGSGIQSIGTYIIFNCGKLLYIKILATTPPTIQSTTFSSAANCPIYVPYGCGNDYKTANNWSSIESRIYELDENGNIPT